MKNLTNKTIISIGEAASLLNVHIDTIRNWEKRGLLHSILTPGGHRRFDKLEIQNLIGKNKMSDKIIHKWEYTGLLEGIKDDNKKKNIALALENQRLFNESQDLPASFRRISIAMIRRVLGSTSIPFISSLCGGIGEPIATSSNYVHHDFASLDSEAGYVTTLCHEINGWLSYWYEQNKKEFIFRAFGLVDGKIVIYGNS